MASSMMPSAMLWSSQEWAKQMGPLILHFQPQKCELKKLPFFLSSIFRYFIITIENVLIQTIKECFPLNRVAQIWNTTMFGRILFLVDIGAIYIDLYKLWSNNFYIFLVYILRNFSWMFSLNGKYDFFLSSYFTSKIFLLLLIHFRG
jgi:hypothetical protein